MPSSAYRMSLTVKFCAVLPASALVTAEIFGVRALLASLIPLSLGVRKGVALFLPIYLVLLQCSGPEEAVSASWQAWQTPGNQLLEARAASASLLPRHSILSWGCLPMPTEE